MPLVETKGAISSQAYGQFARQAVAANYIEDVFSTWLYTGNGSTQTIANGIDLSTKGGLVWMKGRSGATNHALYDTARGATKDLVSNTSDAETTQATGLTSFTSSGFSIGSLAKLNTNAATYASWTFRKQAKFFDLVTYTGSGANRTIAHNLGSVPGCVIVKRTDTTGDWQVYHRSLANTEYVVLNSTAAKATGTTRWNSATPTATEFSLGTDATVNVNNGTYVAYLFAHDAGGFGATGTDNAISCGTFTTDGSGNAAVTLGWEPQWIMRKASSSASTGWEIGDNMRGLLAPPTGSPFLRADSSLGEDSLGVRTFGPTATGFTAIGSPSTTYIYMAIRRGPMRTPTSGTTVFSPIASSAGTGTALTTNFPIDFQISTIRNVTNFAFAVDRLRGVSTNNTGYANVLVPQLTDAESGGPGGGLFWDSTGFQIPSARSLSDAIYWNFRRASGFFDVVCYTGDGTNPRNISHNLGAVPELMLVKRRGPNTQNWLVYHGALGAAAGLVLNTTAAATNPAFYWSATPTSTQFSTQVIPNGSGETYVAYLFASCLGVSKVGSYTGTGTTQQINCGFTGGARFVMIKRTDSTGDWYVWDTARGISAGNDPYLLLNSTAAEVTFTDYISVQSSGFGLTVFAPNALNANGGSYIFFAIA